MKLIDLLIRELPEKGGWPEGATEICWHGKNEVYAYFYGAGGAEFGSPIIVPQRCQYEGDASGFDITREQYEAALAESKQMAWDGVGLPPVGSMVELMDDSHSSTWEQATIKFYGDAFAVWDVNGREESNSLCHVRVRSVRSESERKRDEFARSLCDHLDDLTEWDSPVGNVHALAIFDAIAAGKIPHINLK